jgi:hypothetical protein
MKDIHSDRDTIAGTIMEARGSINTKKNYQPAPERTNRTIITNLVCTQETQIPSSPASLLNSV